MPDSNRRRSGSQRMRRGRKASPPAPAKGPTPRESTGAPTARPGSLPTVKKAASGSGLQKPVPRKSGTDANPPVSSRPAKKGGTSVKMRAVGAKGGGKKSASDRKPAAKGGGKGGRGASRESGKAAGARGKSKGKGGVKAGLAVKFTIPVCLLIAVVIFIWAGLVKDRMYKLHINEIVKDGASVVTSLALTGRRMIADQRKYDDEFGGSDKNPTVADHWLVTGGWISPTEWNRATGLGSSEQLSSDVALKGKKKAMALRGLTLYSADAKNEVLAAYIMTESNTFVAGSEEFVTQVNIDPEPWLSARLDSVKLGNRKLRLGEIEVASSRIGTIKVLQFNMPIRSSRGHNYGKAIVALRADVIQQEQSSISMTMLMIGGVAMVLAIGVCVFIATTVTRPVHTLIRDMHIVAGGDLEHRTRAHSNDEIGKIAVSFNDMTQKLLVARQSEKEIERVENELEMARDIQKNLLPPKVPKVQAFDIDATYIPAKEVGGDYYDFFPIDRRHLGIIVADVSGKSIPGAMVMSTTRTILRFVVPGNISASNTMAKTNSIVAADIKRGMFVTAFYIILDAQNKTCLCASAGHNPMVVVRANSKVDLINPSGIALGFDKGPIFQRTIKEQQIQVGTGDRIVLYTDGVVEAMNSKNEEYTDERFYAFCKNNRGLSSQAFIKALLADLNKHKGSAEQHDDITIVTLKVE